MGQCPQTAHAELPTSPCQNALCWREKGSAKKDTLGWSWVCGGGQHPCSLLSLQRRAFWEAHFCPKCAGKAPPMLLLSSHQGLWLSFLAEAAAGRFPGFPEPQSPAWAGGVTSLFWRLW